MGKYPTRYLLKENHFQSNSYVDQMSPSSAHGEPIDIKAQLEVFTLGTHWDYYPTVIHIHVHIHTLVTVNLSMMVLWCITFVVWAFLFSSCICSSFSSYSESHKLFSGLVLVTDSFLFFLGGSRLVSGCSSMLEECAFSLSLFTFGGRFMFLIFCLSASFHDPCILVLKVT